MNPTGGLPGAALRRIGAQRASGMTSSLLSAPAAASLAAVGLVPVGEVFGCVVVRIGLTGLGCPSYGVGRSGLPPRTTPVTTSSSDAGWSGLAPFVVAYENAWYGAVERLRREAVELGAHGVVGVEVRERTVGLETVELTALGTAVRSEDPIRVPYPEPGNVWCTGLGAEDCTAAVLSSYAPRDLVLGVSVSSKHTDAALATQRSSWDNVEVAGLTELVGAARADARRKVAARAQRSGGSALVVTRMSLEHFETDCGGVPDLHARSIVVGSTLAEVRRVVPRPDAGRVLTVLPLGGASRRGPG